MPSQTARKIPNRMALGLILSLAVTLVAAAFYFYLSAQWMKYIQTARSDDVRTLCTAIETYKVEYKNLPPSLSALGPPSDGGIPNAKAAGLIDSVLASGKKSGYAFHYTPIDLNGKGKLDSFVITADPLSAEGKGHYFMDQSCIVRSEVDRPATVSSPPAR